MICFFKMAPVGFQKQRLFMANNVSILMAEFIFLQRIMDIYYHKDSGMFMGTVQSKIILT